MMQETGSRKKMHRNTCALLFTSAFKHLFLPFAVCHPSIWPWHDAAIAWQQSDCRSSHYAHGTRSDSLCIIWPHFFFFAFFSGFIVCYKAWAVLLWLFPGRLWVNAASISTPTGRVEKEHECPLTMDSCNKWDKRQHLTLLRDWPKGYRWTKICIW